MHARIDIYVKHGRRWVFEDSTCVRATFASATRHYLQTYGATVRANWSN